MAASSPHLYGIAETWQWTTWLTGRKLEAKLAQTGPPNSGPDWNSGAVADEPRTRLSAQKDLRQPTGPGAAD